MVAMDDDAKRDLIELVRKRFPGFVERHSGRIVSDLGIKGDQIVVQMRARIDRLFARATAKIVFNYLSFCLRSGFVLGNSFDPIRHFIRDDQGAPEQFVTVMNNSLLAEETSHVAITRAHLLTLSWDGDRRLEGNFSPYNCLVYKVGLTNFYEGIWRPIRFGNAFDWETHRIQRMVSGQGLVLPDPRRAARAGEALFRGDDTSN